MQFDKLLTNEYRGRFDDCVARQGTSNYYPYFTFGQPNTLLTVRYLATGAVSYSPNFTLVSLSLSFFFSLAPPSSAGVRLSLSV